MDLQKHDTAEKIFFVLMLFFLSGSLFPFNMDQYSTGGREAIEAPVSHLFRYLIAGFYSVTGLLLLYRWRRAVDAVRACPWIVLLLLLACASVLWSTEPELTLRRAIALVGTSIVGLYLVSRFSLRETLSLLAASLTLVFIFSFVLIFFSPEYGINPAPHQGAWRGVFSQKQAAGIYFSLGALVFLGTALYASRVKLSAALLGIICSILFVYKSDSKTALVLVFLVTVAFVFLAFLAHRTHRTSRVWLLALFLIANLIAWTGYTFVDHGQPTEEQSAIADTGPASSGILHSLGRDKTLTGRTVIWNEVIKKAMQRPVAGYGYVGYVWPPNVGEPYAQIRQTIHGKLNFHVNQSHNGYIHLFLALGGIGVLLLVLSVGIIVKDGILCISRTAINYDTMWACLLLLWFLAANITSTLILDQNLIYWTLFIVVAVHLRWHRLAQE